MAVVVKCAKRSNLGVSGLCMPAIALSEHEAVEIYFLYSQKVDRNPEVSGLCMPAIALSEHEAVEIYFLYSQKVDRNPEVSSPTVSGLCDQKFL